MSDLLNKDSQHLVYPACHIACSKVLKAKSYHHIIRCKLTSPTHLINIFLIWEIKSVSAEHTAKGNLSFFKLLTRKISLNIISMEKVSLRLASLQYNSEWQEKLGQLHLRLINIDRAKLSLRNMCSNNTTFSLKPLCSSL